MEWKIILIFKRRIHALLVSENLSFKNNLPPQNGCHFRETWNRTEEICFLMIQLAGSNKGTVLSYQFACILVTPLNHTVSENRKKKQEKTRRSSSLYMVFIYCLTPSFFFFFLLKQVTIIELCTSIKIETGKEMINYMKDFCISYCWW